MADFLLELLSEEIPARMQARARDDLARLFTDQMTAAGVKASGLETYSTPRRLVLIARDLPVETEAVSEEYKGPRAGAADQAIEGFLRKTGLKREQLVERDGVLFGMVEKPGRSTASVLAEAIPAVVRAFPWPKSMRWGEESISTESLRWVRPLQGIVALLGEEIVEVAIAGVQSGAATVGHRFHHPGPITIGSAHDYAEKLRACHVIIDPAERGTMIRAGAEKAAATKGLTVVPDEGLVEENAGLTAWPVPLVGGFDPAFLEVPREVIQLTMRTNQKYFACNDAAGNLAPNFLCVANIEASDGGAAIAAGNEKVLAARLADAKFFWEQDLKVPLAEQALKLDQIVFHQSLGTVADKSKRVKDLALDIVRELEDQWGVNSPQSLVQLQNHVQDAALLAKADLVTGMVGEFPELQGIIGGYLARSQGYPPQIAQAIQDHYKPAGVGDESPSAPATVSVSIADKLDSVVAFFLIGEAPTGSKDPFALRRAALGIISTIFATGLRVRLLPLIERHIDRIQVDMATDIRNARRKAADYAGVSAGSFASGAGKAILAKEVCGQKFSSISWEVLGFFADRLKVQQREAGVRHDLIDAVFSLGNEDDLVRLLARVRALQEFIQSDDGADLLTGYKRAANILRKESWSPAKHKSLPTGHREPEEEALIKAFDQVEPKLDDRLRSEDFAGAMTELARLRPPVDAFFDKVIVNDPEEAKRESRLSLLARMRDAVHRVADFSKIEG